MRCGTSGSGTEIQTRTYRNINGYIGIASAFFRTGSSEVYKEGIRRADDLDALALVRRAGPKRFRMKNIVGAGEELGEYVPGPEQLGFIAEEMPAEIRVDDGYEITRMLAVLWKAVQELDARIPTPGTTGPIR